MTRDDATAVADAIIEVVVAKINMDHAFHHLPKYAHEKEAQNFALKREALINKLTRKVLGQIL